VEKLLAVLQALLDGGNTVAVIEHNLDVIATADWVIDLGPEGGCDGGRVVAAGRPGEVVKVEGSHTGRFLGGMWGERQEKWRTRGDGKLTAKGENDREVMQGSDCA